MMIVGLEGKLHREVKIRTRYIFDSSVEYESFLTVAPHDGKIVDSPELGFCSKTGRTVPFTCLSKCEVTGGETLRCW
jgi:hypothetical protein